MPQVHTFWTTFVMFAIFATSKSAKLTVYIQYGFKSLDLANLLSSVMLYTPNRLRSLNVTKVLSSCKVIRRLCPF